MKRTSLRNICLTGLAILAAGAASALADTWPARVVTLVIPFGPGSGSDIVGRILANKISEGLGEQMIVEDVGGAGGTIAVSRVAKAPPDGYQIALGAVDTFAQSQFLFKEPPSNTATDFTPIGLAVEQPLLLVVRNDLPVSNLKEFAAYLKTNQEKMRFGSAGIGAAPYLACSMLTTAIGAKATHVPYRAAAPALQDMVRGDIDYYCPLSISVSGMIEAKSVKPLAILTKDRSPLYPDLPTAREQGINVTDGYYWMGLFAPKGTPEPVVAKLNAALEKALNDSTMQARLREASATVVAPGERGSAYLKDYLPNEIAKWAGIMKANNVPQQ
ncbi:MAG TPA: tripartite tricarboxylate transporter substrate binding protein [Xanthobacteraceae bacterium]|jgi:tripartite-type tricarboxylate transporter receptor subunit TctC|nr:tripartite tricarboxylate transporter substrate binding protein [Xanthobacteraceae bacterium]